MERRALIAVVLIYIALGGFVSNALADECIIYIRPQVINLSSFTNPGGLLWVHTNLPYDESLTYTASMATLASDDCPAGIPAENIYYDDLGNIIVGFSRFNIASNVSVGAVTLRVCIQASNGFECEGSDIVNVIDVKQEGEGEQNMNHTGG